MKRRINTILPIALAIILPGLNFFSNSEAAGVHFYTFYERWFYASFVIYILWYLLLLGSRIKTKYRNWIISGIVFLFAIIVYTLFVFFVFKIPNTIKWAFITKLFFAAVLFLIIQYALRANENISKLELEKEQIKSEIYKVQLQELRTKVEPHFLFNSFNTLRTMIRNNNPFSEQFVMNLSNFYRMTLTLNNTPTTLLKEEIDVLKSYLFLIQTRYGGGINIMIDIDEELLKRQLPTLSLQILAENCFKHNKTSMSNPLEITITSYSNDYISVKNNKLPKLTIEESSGFGLHNIAQRYELLKISNGIIKLDTDDFFEVKLKLI